MNAKIRTGAAFVAAALLCAVGSTALAGSWKFTIENRSDAAVTDFFTLENGEWSSNWLSARIKTRETFELDFGYDTGPCTIPTRIKFSDGTYFDEDVDYCSVSHFVVYNDHVALR
ncbi:hypothetical protein [Chthonobacter rhizosphaerae]|uniref:hypothetical protein n=1 Tax=Chthonobacter rhizosphaerae TaxID=2735553 RepID=UPI0015EF17DD|nr:hypothetical protein [Chthonobacter rhizosphaerae]